MSSDSDFTPLVSRLRQDGLPVYCFGDGRTPQALQTACTRFIDVEKLIAGDKKAEGGGRTSIDQELVDLLGDAWKAANRDDEGYARLQEVGQIAGNRSSFDVRNYGFKRLSAMFKEPDNFKLVRRDDQPPYARRLRQDPTQHQRT